MYFVMGDQVSSTVERFRAFPTLVLSLVGMAPHVVPEATTSLQDLTTDIARQLYWEELPEHSYTH